MTLVGSLVGSIFSSSLWKWIPNIQWWTDTKGLKYTLHGFPFGKPINIWPNVCKAKFCVWKVAVFFNFKKFVYILSCLFTIFQKKSAACLSNIFWLNQILAPIWNSDCRVSLKYHEIFNFFCKKASPGIEPAISRTVDRPL